MTESLLNDLLHHMATVSNITSKSLLDKILNKGPATVSNITSKALLDVRDAFDKERELARVDEYLAHERYLLAAIKDLIDAEANNIPVVTK